MLARHTQVAESASLALFNVELVCEVVEPAADALECIPADLWSEDELISRLDQSLCVEELTRRVGPNPL
jgi:hypothetical protein